jgi:hypothetical protein
VPQFDLVVGGAASTRAGEFEVGFVTEASEQRLSLTEAWSVPFESCRPVRRFPSYKGQRHYVGQWWTATTGTLVGFESWLERDRLMLLDFDPDTVGLASQPFWLFWTTAEGRSRSHVPDYFARLTDGTALVLDCRPLDRIKPKGEVAFEATRAACEMLGWHYEIVGAPPEMLLANVRWLAGYRHPRHDLCLWSRRPCARCSPGRYHCSTAPRPPAIRLRCCRCCFTCSGDRSWSRTYPYP